MATTEHILTQAVHAYQGRDYQRAVALCRRAIQVDRVQADIWYLLGSASLALGHGDDAVQAYTQGTHLRPEDPEFQNALALALAGKGQWTAALPHFEKSLHLRPSSAEAHDNLGLAFKALGRIDEAVVCFRAALQLDPRSINAHSNLGVALREKGDLAGAVACFSRALELEPHAPGIHNNLGLVLEDQGKFDEAETSFREALRLLPGSVEIHNNLGRLLKEQGRTEEAERTFREFARRRSDLPAAHNSLGVMLLEEGRAKDAEVCFRQALTLDSQGADAQNNLGRVLREQHRYLEALASFEHALVLRPDSAEVFNNLGMVLRDLERLTEAEARFRQAIDLVPERAEFHDNLGLVLQEQGRPDEAEACFHEALRHDPSYANACNNVGMILAEAGKLEEAEASFRRAIQLNPNLAEAHYNFGQHQLRLGDFETGWEEHEWRLKVKEKVPSRRYYSGPFWDGSPLNGQTILLHAEQGFGDTIQFVRYGSLVRECGGTVVLECPEKLLPLLSRCVEFDQLIASGSPLPHFDVHAPLMSLPRILGTRLETVPAVVPYLTADPVLVEYWQRELSALSGFKVGIVWQGNPRFAGDRFRSIPLEQFGPLARVEGVQLISLQIGVGCEQLPAFADRLSVVDLGSRFNHSSGPFMDTAAAIRNLDLVVTPDTAVGHLAGALGVPIWLALPFLPDPRWLLGREDSPWYPTMRLFRQHERGDWDGVFQRVAAALVDKIS